MSMRRAGRHYPVPVRISASPAAVLARLRKVTRRDAAVMRRPTCGAFRCLEPSTSILSGSGTGVPVWIRMAAQLKPSAEGAAAEDLDIALRVDALSAEPLLVLPCGRRGAVSLRPVRSHRRSHGATAASLAGLWWLGRLRRRQRGDLCYARALEEHLPGSYPPIGGSSRP